MKLVVGLGNPGLQYASTRHNAGLRVVESLARRWGLRIEDSRWQGHFGSGRLGEHEVGLLTPTTFMNRSGECVRAAVDALGNVAPAADLLVAYDDLDLPLGRLRLRARGGCGGHRGMESIAEELGSEDFPRLRFGIGRPASGIDVVDYVLSAFEPDEMPLFEAAVVRAAEAIEAVVSDGLDDAMSRFNRAEPEPSADEERSSE